MIPRFGIIRRGSGRRWRRFIGFGKECGSQKAWRTGRPVKTGLRIEGDRFSTTQSSPADRVSNEAVKRSQDKQGAWHGPCVPKRGAGSGSNIVNEGDTRRRVGAQSVAHPAGSFDPATQGEGRHRNRKINPMHKPSPMTPVRHCRAKSKPPGKSAKRRATPTSSAGHAPAGAHPMRTTKWGPVTGEYAPIIRAHPQPSSSICSVYFPYDRLWLGRAAFKILILLASPTGFEPVLPP